MQRLWLSSVEMIFNTRGICNLYILHVSFNSDQSVILNGKQKIWWWMVVSLHTYTLSESYTRVNTTYMKNWDPFVSLPRLAIDKRKALSCLRVKFSSVEERYGQRGTLSACRRFQKVVLRRRTAAGKKRCSWTHIISDASILLLISECFLCSLV